MKSAMRSQQFPVVLSDLLDELLHIFIVEELEKHLAGDAPLVPMSEIRALAATYKKTMKTLRAHSVGSPQ